MSDIAEVLPALEERRANVRMELAVVYSEAKGDNSAIDRILVQYHAVMDTLLHLQCAENETRKYERIRGSVYNVA